jgi:hypothetical protein
MEVQHGGGIDPLICGEDGAASEWARSERPCAVAAQSTRLSGRSEIFNLRRRGRAYPTHYHEDRTHICLSARQLRPIDRLSGLRSKGFASGLNLEQFPAPQCPPTLSRIPFCQRLRALVRTGLSALHGRNCKTSHPSLPMMPLSFER